MLEITVNVKCQDLAIAAAAFAAALNHEHPAPTSVPGTMEVPQPNAASVPAANVPAQSVSQVPEMPQAPVAQAPSYSMAQIATAGANLMSSNPALQTALVDLLHKYGAQTVQDVPQDKLGAFATELRQMGAKI